jgi:hypothetical protein
VTQRAGGRTLQAGAQKRTGPAAPQDMTALVTWVIA